MYKVGGWNNEVVNIRNQVEPVGAHCKRCDDFVVVSPFNVEELAVLVKARKGHSEVVQKLDEMDAIAKGSSPVELPDKDV